MRSHDGWTKGHTYTPLLQRAYNRKPGTIRHIVLVAVRDARGNCRDGLAVGDENLEAGEFAGEILDILIDLSEWQTECT
jgi:hypothetical protein